MKVSEFPNKLQFGFLIIYVGFLIPVITYLTEIKEFNYIGVVYLFSILTLIYSLFYYEEYKKLPNLGRHNTEVHTFIFRFALLINSIFLPILLILEYYNGIYFCSFLFILVSASGGLSILANTLKDEFT